MGIPTPGSGIERITFNSRMGDDGHTPLGWEAQLPDAVPSLETSAT
jgi:hypothetical protein